MSKIVYSCGTIQRLSAPCPAACIGCCAPDNADMPLAPTTQIFSNTATQLSAWAHAIAPAGSAAFDALAWVSLAFYLLFAVVALNYALKAWAEKAMLVGIAGGTAASLVLYLSLRHTPDYTGEGALWKFVALSQYLPLPVISLGLAYALYRCVKSLRGVHK